MASSPLILIILATTAVFGLFLAMPCTADNALSSPDNLYTGQSLSTGSYVLTMQSDCNLVLYAYGNPIWATNTGGSGSGCRLAMQNDGNLVVYDGSGRAVWASGTSGQNANYVLVLQKDRNVVIYGPARWATGTYKGTVGVTVLAQNSTETAAEQVIMSVA